MNKVESMRHISFAAVLLLAAYGDGGTTPTPPATPVATSVTLTATSLSFASLGETFQMFVQSAHSIRLDSLPRPSSGVGGETGSSWSIVK